MTTGIDADDDRVDGRELQPPDEPGSDNRLAEDVREKIAQSPPADDSEDANDAPSESAQ